jgi:uncharacterized protein (DUF2062 family)
MPRRLAKKLANLIRTRRHKWYMNIFGDRLTDSHLWTLNRHSITAAFGVGIAVSFIPLPIHLPLVVLAALWWRLNLAVAIAATYLVNPFTMVPAYYMAYRVGAALLRFKPHHFEFHLTWNWLEHGLGPAWRPFLLGCLVCGVLLGLTGRFALEVSWRLATMHRYRLRQRRRALRPSPAPAAAADLLPAPAPDPCAPPGADRASRPPDSYPSRD